MDSGVPIKARKRVVWTEIGAHTWAAELPCGVLVRTEVVEQPYAVSGSPSIAMSLVFIPHVTLDVIAPLEEIGFVGDDDE